MKTKRQNKKSKGGAVITGCLACLLSFLGAMLIFSLIAFSAKDPLSVSDAYSPLAFALAGLIAGRIGKRISGEERLFLFCPPILVLSLLLIGLFLSGGKISPSALLSEAIYLASAYLAFFISARKRAPRRRKH